VPNTQYKHYLGYIEGWQAQPSAALQRGTDWHTILDVWYQAQLPGAAEEQRAWAVRKVDQLIGRKDPESTAQQDLLAWMWDGYRARWHDEALEWQPLESEQRLELPLPRPDGKPSRFIVRARIDLLARYRPTRRLWLWDHKTGQNLPKERDLDFEDQFGLYVWLLRRMGRKIQGCVYNAARTQRNVSAPQPLAERFSRTLLAKTDAELAQLAAEVWATAEMMYPEDRPPLWPPPRTMDSDRCKWRCGFNEGCLAGRKGMAIESHMVAHNLERREAKPVLWRDKGHTLEG
jgi:RecB family exonuclease